MLTLGNGLASPAPGTVTRLLTPAQTELLTGEWQYTLDVTFSDGTVTRYYRGGAQQGTGDGRAALNEHVADLAVGELAERNPNEAVSIVRQWLSEPVEN